MDKIKFKNQINKITYTHTKELPTHGIGQCTENGRTKWTFISIPMMEVVDEVAPGCIIQLSSGNKTWSIKMMGFVDDKCHYTNEIKNHADKCGVYENVLAGWLDGECRVLWMWWCVLVGWVIHRLERLQIEMVGINCTGWWWWWLMGGLGWDWWAEWWDHVRHSANAKYMVWSVK